jgi:pyrroline-5-carboxylate reductase
MTTEPDPGREHAAGLHVGVVGVGTIAAALVDAIATGPHGDDVSFALSPRSAHRAAELAARHPRATVLGDNQAVIDAGDVVLLCVLPGQVRDVCAGLRFRADQTVVGLAAGWPPSALAGLVAPAERVCQLIPLPMVTLHVGPIVLHPVLDEVSRLLDGCGEIVGVPEERDIIALSCASATMSTFFELQQTAVDWLVAQGFDQGAARHYMSALFEGLAREAARAPVEQGARLAVEHETPGGLNEQVRTALTDLGTFDELRTVLSRMHHERRQTG